MKIASRIRKGLGLLIILLHITGCLSTVDNQQNIAKERIQSTLDSLVLDNDIPGLNFSIIYMDGIQENYSSGFANVKKQIPLTAEHVMFSGSVGKTYAVAVLMQMVEEGKLNLNDKFIDYFPEVEWLRGLPNIDDITIKMLLSHTSGLPRYVMKDEVWSSMKNDPDKVWSYEDRLSLICGDTAVHAPGEGWAYSDSNYILLGMLIEKLSNDYYYDEVSDRLLDPLGLHSTYAAVRRDIENLPVGYSKLPEMFAIPPEVVVEGKFIFNPQMEWTGGGFASTTPDLASWAGFYYHGGIISDTLLVAMTTPSEQGRNLDETTSYGMGSFIYVTTHGPAYGHTGFMPGFNTIFAWFPEQEMAVALQANCDYAANKMGLINYVDEIVTVVLSDTGSR